MKAITFILSLVVKDATLSKQEKYLVDVNQELLKLLNRYSEDSECVLKMSGPIFKDIGD